MYIIQTTKNQIILINGRFYKGTLKKNHNNIILEITNVENIFLFTCILLYKY